MLSLSLSLRSHEISKQQGGIFGTLECTPKSSNVTHKMPVAGLSTAFDSALEALLKENGVSSWKILAEGKKTTAVRRLALNTGGEAG